MEFISKWKISLIASLIFLLILIGFVSYKGKDVSLKAYVHVHKPVSFPKNIPELKVHTLVFFGDVGCKTVCDPRMQEVTSIYNNFIDKSGTDKLSVLFINLDESKSSKEADRYAKSFHPQFKGISFEKKEILSTMRMFNAYYSHSIMDSENIEHSQFLYFVHKDTMDNFYLFNIYINIPFNVELITNDLIKDMR